MKLTLLITLCCWSLAGGQTVEQYGTANDGTPLHWKVYAPTGGGKHPAVLCIPGGGFKNLFGIPSAVTSDIKNAGYLVLSNVEYRTAPPNKLTGQVTDGRFPDQTDDIELAAAAAKSDSRCNGVVLAVGGSAGASHAAWLAGKGLVQAAVLLSPAMQLDDAESLARPNFGNDVRNYAPTDEERRDASPDNMLTSNSGTIFIVAFTQDNMPAPQYTLGVAKLASLGVPYDSRLLSGQGHSWPAWTSISTQAIAFLNAHRGTPSPTPTATATPTSTPNPTATETPTPDPTSTPVALRGIGIGYMIPSDYVDSPQKIPKPEDQAFKNPHTQYVTCRTSWARIEPHEHFNPTDFYWEFLDGCVANAAMRGKKASIMVSGGTKSPKWIYAAGATSFSVTEGDGSIDKMPLPWDLVFQKKWGAMQHELGVRYGNNPAVAYFDLTIGRKVEADFVATPTDVAKFNSLGGLTKWKEGVQWMIDKRFTEIPNKPSTLVTGTVIPGKEGQAALQAVIDYGKAKHPGNHFAIASHGLWPPNGPGENSIGAKEALLLTKTSTPGFQVFGSVVIRGPGTAAFMDQALALGVKWGARFIEVRAKDCDNPLFAATLDKWGAYITAH